MATGGIDNCETRQFKDAMLVEIFKVYRASGTVYQKASDPETRRTTLDLKRCCDLAIQHLAPLGARAEQLREELGRRFADGPPGTTAASPVQPT